MNIDDIAGPNLKTLARRLPIMRNGKPRKFRLFCECFEWCFNQFYNVRVRSFASAENKVQKAENFAHAMWRWQNPRT